MTEVFYDLLLLAYPRDFRERHGEEMRRLFLERLRDARERSGFPGVAWLWLRTLVDFLINAPPERLRTIRDPKNRGGGGMDSLLKDVRYGLRTLMKNPTFTVIAALTIGLGIGANTAIFSVVRAVLLAPLPYDEPSELMIVWSELTTRDVDNFPLSPPVWDDMRRTSDVFEDLAGVMAFPQPVNIEGRALQLEVGSVTHNFFTLLGTDLLMGRHFDESDAAPVAAEGGNAFNAGANQPSVAILTHSFWQTFFGGDPSALGQSLDVGGNFVEVVGILPEDFELLLPPAASVAPDVAFWTAQRIDVGSWDPANVMFPLVGRLAPGRTVDQAQTELDRYTETWAQRVPVFASAGNRYWTSPLHEDLTAEVRPVVLALLGAVGFVLLIACANVSNLLLVRAATREREMAVRAAMGGSRGRLLRQMLVESGVLALMGAVLGLVVAQLGIRGLLALQPENLPRVDAVRIDGLVLGFTLVASLVAAVLFGVIPAVQGSRLQLAESLKDRGKATAAARNKWLRQLVVVSEVALSVVLLVGAGLMIRSFAELQSVDPGYETEGMLTFQAPLPPASYPTTQEVSLTMAQMRERIGGLPGVEGVTSIFPALLDPTPLNGRYGTEEALEDDSYFKQAAYKVVTPGFFETAGVELVEGRFLDRADQADSAAVVVVDRRLAETTFPGESAIGKRILIRFFTPEPSFVEIVGVVENLRHATLSEVNREAIFFPDRLVGSNSNTTWIVRADNPLGLVESIRSEIEAIDPSVPLAEVRLMEDFVAADMGPTRFSLTLIAVFGLTALILASVGLYGVLSNVVKQRTAEIGVRMAFGAEPGSILRLVVRQGLVLAGVGLLVGLVAAFGVTGAMESLLVGVEPADPLAFGGTALTFLVVAMFSCWVPAYRATRVDPVVALRDD